MEENWIPRIQVGANSKQDLFLSIDSFISGLSKETCLHEVVSMQGFHASHFKKIIFLFKKKKE